MKVLVTGGAGYIGSTICSALADRGHAPVILDSLVKGRREFTRGKIFYQGDIADRNLLEKIFSQHPEIAAVIHCAAWILVPESMAKPFEYYRENVAKSNEFFHHLHALNCNKIVFSSSASVYDTVPGFMVTENAPLNPQSPYARTKYMMECVLKDFGHAYGTQSILLRYFNPIAADPQLRSGVYTRTPTHIVDRLVDTSLGKIDEFHVTGIDWPTRDGTGIRDYIHVWDLALAHVQAIEKFASIFAQEKNRTVTINLGTGVGVTVKEMVSAFLRVSGKKLNIKETAARPGDVAGAYANADTAERLLGWKPQKSVDECIADALRWAHMRDEVLGNV